MNITLKDHFAVLAMQGLLASNAEMDMSPISIATLAYDQADALMNERNAREREAYDRRQRQNHTSAVEEE